MLITLGSPPTATETAAWHAVVSAAHVRDLPAAVPEPSKAETAGKLSLPPVGGRNVHLASTAADGSYDGVASLLLFSDEHLRHTALLDPLVVHPKARRHGIGAKLWTAIRAELAADGRTSITTVLELGGAGEAFVDSLGFTNVQPLGWYVQKVGQALEEIPEPPLPEGLRFADWTGSVPDEWAEAFARARGTERDAFGEAPVTHQLDRDVARAKAVARLIEQRGGVVLTSAVLEPEADDAVAAYTEVVLKAPTDARALQHATVVVPRHRGRGLGRAVKRHLLAGLHERHPGVREISTTVADENTSMLAVNESLGYRRERPAGLFEAKL
ncbi:MULTISPECIES: GNAT family N-acetyltransferase [unclassified Streptomyces]|uniref:GNAT family N-acetyltransferase n=1 Tax=unclassified Streptomyces TaxID=2593676 RepID=UPI0006936C45|nr:GNAT family N-acetyltransferase [Streptomyces sp. NBC_00370]